MSDSLLIEQDGHVVTLTLNRPDRLNALDGDLIGDLNDAWRRIDADPSVRAIVVTGAGRAFCSGADVGALGARGDAGDEGGGPAATDDYPRFTARHLGVFKPVITAVNGVCAGAALHFLADTDIAIASTAASFVDTHVNVGQVTALEPIGLTRRIGLAPVLRMVVLGRYERLGAERARDLGLVSEVVDPGELLARAQELAGMAASASPVTMQASLRAIWESLNMGLEAALDHGYGFVTSHWGHPDSTEGPRAFMEKRDPEWTVE